MKRSTTIGLGAVGVVLAASAWSHFGGENRKFVYADEAACRAHGKLTGAECDQRFQEARAAYLREARRFGDQSACEAEFGAGKCALGPPGPGSSGGPSWAPALAGFMVARGLMSGSTTAQPLLPPTREACPPGATTPQCQPTRSGSAVGLGGSRTGWYSTTSGTNFSTSRAAGPANVNVASRGGFGGVWRSFSSGS